MKNLKKTIFKASMLALGLSPFASNAQWTNANPPVQTGNAVVSGNLSAGTLSSTGNINTTGNILLNSSNVNGSSLPLYIQSVNTNYGLSGGQCQGIFMRFNNLVSPNNYLNFFDFGMNSNDGFFISKRGNSSPNTDPSFVISTDNNVGIGTGTTTLVEKLEVNGRIKVTGFVLPGSLLTGKVLTSDASGVGTWQNLPAPPASLWVSSGTCGNDISYNPTVGMGCTKNVGIGTSTPTAKLDVNGTFNAQGIAQFFSDVYAYGNLNVSTSINTPAIYSTSYIQIGSAPKDGSGNLLVPGGTSTNGFQLSVKGKIYCQEVNVTPNNASNWADYVFKSDYKLNSLTDVEKYIKENGHLENVPSADEVAKSGYKLGEMDATLLRKIEELTLYMLAQQKEIEGLKAQIKK